MLFHYTPRQLVQAMFNKQDEDDDTPVACCGHMHVNGLYSTLVTLNLYTQLGSPRM